MPPYPVRCYGKDSHGKDCTHLADYKIAARWSDGVLSELKTYYLACSACVSALFQHAKVKHAACRLAAGETLGDPMIYELVRGQRDRERTQRPELEQ
jgi:hypothetical protein